MQWPYPVYMWCWYWMLWQVLTWTAVNMKLHTLLGYVLLDVIVIIYCYSIPQGVTTY